LTAIETDTTANTRWVRVSESYDWLTYELGLGETEPYENYPRDKYAQVPEELWQRLLAAEDALADVQAEVDRYAKSRHVSRTE